MSIGTRSFAAVFALLLCACSVFAVGRPILAVPSIKPSKVSESVAAVCRNLVETALIKTEQYQIISYTDIEEILEAQKFSLEDCTDEDCAIEIGKLLAAERIVVGELTGLGERMVLALRMVDVTTGKTTGAEIANIASLDEIEDQCFAAAYRIAGLQYAGRIGSVAGEGSLYVFAPEGMVLNVYLDGELAGTTPLLVENLSFGNHQLRAETDDYEYQRNVLISTNEMVEILADRSSLVGRLFVGITPTNASGFTLLIDDLEQSVGLVKDLAVGEHHVRVEGGGWLYDGAVSIEQDATARLDVVLTEVGHVKVDIPLGSKALFRNSRGMVISAHPDQLTTLEVGTWQLSLSHPDYKPFHGEMQVTRGQEFHVNTPLEHTAEHKRSTELERLETERLKASRTRSGLRVGAVVTMAIGFAASAVAVACEGIISDRTDTLVANHAAYQAATDTTQIGALRDAVSIGITQISILRTIRNASLIGVGVCGAVGGLLMGLRPSVDTIDAEIGTLLGGGE